jgi:protein-tyrosine phosphatase
MHPRTRKTTHQLSASEIKHHSPIKNGHFKHSKNFNEDEPVTSYNKIMSKIYLGNIDASKDKDFFKDKNIKAVLNCSKDIPNTFKNSDVEYMRIPVDDSLKVVDYNKMYHYLPMAADFIYKHAVLQKQPIFVHCYAGRQRSCATIAAFLMKYHNLTPYEACLFITKKRIEAFHFNLSLNFEQSLDEFYKDIKKCPKKIRQPKFKD